MNHKLSLVLSVVSVGEAVVLSAGFPSTTISWPARPRHSRTSRHLWSAFRTSKALKRDKERGRQKGSGSRPDREGRRRDKESDSDNSDESDSDISGSDSEGESDGKRKGKSEGKNKNKDKEPDNPPSSSQQVPPSPTTTVPSKSQINNAENGPLSPTSGGNGDFPTTTPGPTDQKDIESRDRDTSAKTTPPTTSVPPSTASASDTTGGLPGSGPSSASNSTSPTATNRVSSNPGQIPVSAPWNEPSFTPVPSDLAPADSRPKQTAAIVGVVLGGAALLLLLLLAAFLFIRARRQRTRPDSRPHTFYKDRMIKDSDVENVPPTPLTPISISSSGSISATRPSLSDLLQVNFGGNPALGLGIPSRTSRQMQIEQKIFELQSSLISLNRRTISFRRSNVSSKKVRGQLIRDKIGRLEKLKEGDWAREKSDEKPADMN
ncbi:hypothetical protein PM082_021207 [Marasmius tenuissimus]|nr:hypothetical protein PM082_021207 [Marasmius tenuissimus]